MMRKLNQMLKKYKTDAEKAKCEAEKAKGGAEKARSGAEKGLPLIYFSLLIVTTTIMIFKAIKALSQAAKLFTVFIFK